MAKYKRDIEKAKKVKFLSQYINLVREHEEIINCYNLFYNRLLYPAAQTLTDMPKGGNFAAERLSGDIVKLEKIRKVIERKKREICNKYMLIERTIDSCEEPMHRTILRLRYISGMEWEKVCVAINYEWRQTHRLHKEALESVMVVRLAGNSRKCKIIEKKATNIVV